MLIGNKRQFYSTPWSYFGQVFTGAENPRLNYRWRFTGESWAKNASVPLGTEGSYAYVLAIDGGGLVSDIVGDGSLVGYAVNGVNLEWDLEGSGDLVGSVNLIATLIANLAGSGSLTGNLVGTVQLASDMVGSGDLLGGLKLFAGLVADLNGSGDLSGNLKGTASMSADIYVNESELQVAQIVNGVWNAVASEYTTPWSTWEALQSGWSGGGATPAQIWSYSSRTLTESAGLTPEQNDKLMSLSNWWGAGGFMNYSNINNHTTAKAQEILKQMEKLKKQIDELPPISFDEVNANIKIAKDDIIDKMNSEVGELSETVKAIPKEVKADGEKTREVVKSKSEGLGKNLTKLVDRQDLIDKKIESEADEIEEKLDEYAKEADEIEAGLMEQYGAEADEIEKVTT
jgi:polyhydroxyalkanoate synthesis regulator phasin